MRGTWDDVNRRLAGAILALDLDDVLVVAEQVEQPRKAFFRKQAPPPPHRWASVTAARTALIAEVVGSTSFGGEWDTAAEVEALLTKQGWQKPWSPDLSAWMREAPLQKAPVIALAIVRALQALGCEVADLEVTLRREESAPMVEALARSTDIPLDAHLMIADADRHAPTYVEAGCASVTFHVEAAAAPVRLAREIRAAGGRASMALKPATPVEPYEDMLGELDMLLLMTVEPGFGGQKFLDLVLPKIRRARALMDKHGVETWLQVDGGVSLETIERCAEAGADTFVAGSAVFSADDPDAMVNALRAKASDSRD